MNETTTLDARGPLEGVLRLGVLSILFQAEMLAIAILQIQQNIIYYYVSLIIAIVFVGLIRFAGPSRFVADIQELCFFDVVIQLVVPIRVIMYPSVVGDYSKHGIYCVQ